MPAIITHDLFGRDLLCTQPSLIGPSPEERDAFLLGNQGPAAWENLATGEVVTLRPRPVHA